MKPSYGADMDDDDGGVQYWQQVGQWQETARRGSALRTRTRQGSNMRTSDMLESKYLKAGDFEDGPTTLTMRDLKKTNLARDDEDPKYRWVLFFIEKSKGMVLNATNIKRIEAVYGGDTDNWIDKPIVVYYDENVSFGADIVGGLRVKGPAKPKPSAAAAKYDGREPPPFE